MAYREMVASGLPKTGSYETSSNFASDPGYSFTGSHTYKFFSATSAFRPQHAVMSTGWPMPMPVSDGHPILQYTSLTADHTLQPDV